MNEAPESYVLVSEADLLAFATTCFEKVGLDHDHATLISRFLVNSDLRGVRSHGTRALNGYCRSFSAGHLNPQPDICQVHETPTAVVIEGDGALGYWPMVQATEAAIAKAKDLGMGMGLVRYTLGIMGRRGIMLACVWNRAVSAFRCKAIEIRDFMAMMAAAPIPKPYSVILAIRPSVLPSPVQKDRPLFWMRQPVFWPIINEVQNMKPFSPKFQRPSSRALVMGP